MNITRRGFLQGAIGLAGAGMTAALTVPALKTLLPPPVTRCNKDDAHETLTFKAEGGKWYENKGNEVAKVSDFSMVLVHPEKPGKIFFSIPTCQAAKNKPERKVNSASQ